MITQLTRLGIATRETRKHAEGGIVKVKPGPPCCFPRRSGRLVGILTTTR